MKFSMPSILLGVDSVAPPAEPKCYPEEFDTLKLISKHSWTASLLIRKKI